jgi:membrane protein required for beta-lactamase induction
MKKSIKVVFLVLVIVLGVVALLTDVLDYLSYGDISLGHKILALFIIAGMVVSFSKLRSINAQPQRHGE